MKQNGCIDDQKQNPNTFHCEFPRGRGIYFTVAGAMIFGCDELANNWLSDERRCRV